MNQLINELGKITRWPKKKSDQKYIIKYLSEKFEFGIRYSEKEINQINKKYHDFKNKHNIYRYDVPLLRRELISKKYLSRKNDCSEYRKL